MVLGVVLGEWKTLDIILEMSVRVKERGDEVRRC